MTTQSAFSLHQTEDVSWQLVMISSLSGCSNYNFQMIQKYTEITEKYLELYNVPNSNHESLCLTEENYQSYYQPPEDVDLLVLIYDKNKGEFELHENDVGGIYSHVGYEWTHNHTIVICDCPNFYFSDPVWILSHELSHFVLNYKGYDLDVVEKQIHRWDKKFDDCTEYTFDETCSEGKTKIKTDYYSYSWTVMSPYEPAIAKPIMPLENKTAILDSSFKIKMMHKVTEWWLDGKIKDSDYVSTMMIYSEEKPRSLNDNIILPKTSSKLFLTEPPKKDEGIVKYSDLNKNNDNFESEYLDSFKADDPTVLPTWFKTRAGLWQAEEITDEEFNTYLASAVGTMDCKEGFEIVVKKSTGKQFCVKPKTVEKLIERGWAVAKPHNTVQKVSFQTEDSQSVNPSNFDSKLSINELITIAKSDSVWQYREQDTKRYFDPEFRFTGTSEKHSLRVFSSYNSFGTGWVFKTFDKNDLLNRDIKITWSAGGNGPATSTATLKVLDGSYDRSNDDDFPLFRTILKGGGEITRLNGGVKFAEKTDVISPNFGESELDKVTIFIQRNDNDESTEYFLKLRSIEIDDLGIWMFEDPGITVEKSGSYGDFGTIEATFDENF